MQEAGTPLEKTLEEAYALFEQRCYREALDRSADIERQVTADLADEARAAVLSSIENFRGFCFLGLEDLNEARDCFERGLRANPQSSQACAGLGEVFYLSGLEKEAKTMYEWAVRCDPGYRAAVEGLAEANRALGLPSNDNSLQGLLQESD